MTFSERFACLRCGTSMPELEPRIFSFNSPHGACERCTGLGSQMEIDPDLVVPDPSLSIGEGALAPWAGSASQYYEQVTQAIAEKYDIDLEAAWESLDEDARDLFLHGTNGERVEISYRNRYGRRRSYATRFEGIIPNLERRYRETDSELQREKIEEYMLLAAHRELAALMPYLHLPVQSGSDRVLAAMNRRHKRVDYLRLIDRIRAARSDIALASDFIVGFPGETDADFDDTLRLIDEVGYAAAFSFKYSPRPGTPAATAGDQIPEAVKAERLAELQARIDAHQAAFMRSRVGTVAEVLFERGGRHPGQIVGRSPWLSPVQVEADAGLIGTIARVTIDRAAPNSLFGSLVAAHPAEAVA